MTVTVGTRSGTLAGAVVLVQGATEETEDKELARGAVSVRFDPLPPDRAATVAR